MNLKQEFSLWESAGAEKPTGPLGVAVKTRLGLEAQAKVKFVTPPEKKFSPNGPAFGVVVPFRVPTTGLYRLSFGRKVWSDVVDSGAKSLVKAQEFEMQTGCPKIFKVILVSLETDRLYDLQISGSPEDAVDVLLTKAP